MYNNVGSTVPQVLSAHLLTTRLGDNLVVFINDVDPLRACRLCLFHHPLKPFRRGAVTRISF